MTKIEWTHRPGTTGVTWNPIRARHRDTGALGWACVRVSEGCMHCYSATQNRAGARGGTGLDYTVPALAQVDVYLDERTLAQPLHWRQPHTVFVCSMTDLFGEWVPEEFISEIFRVMRQAAAHSFILLTKRPARMRDVVRREVGERGYLPPNIWLGVSVENQEAADARIPILMRTPAAVRFLSCEPLIGPIDLFPWLERASWSIIGGESGPRFRPCEVAWIESIVAQCREAGVAAFVKQDSGRWPGQQGRIPDDLWAAKEWPGA